MALLVIFTLVGMALGEAIFYDNGWLIGAGLGFLITKVVLMGNHIKRLERDVNALKTDSQSAARFQWRVAVVDQYIGFASG